MKTAARVLAVIAALLQNPFVPDDEEEPEGIVVPVTKAQVVVFWSHGCPYCPKPGGPEEVELKKVGWTVGPEASNQIRYVDVAKDYDYYASLKGQTTGIPLTVLLSKEGTVVKRTVGKIPAREIAQMLTEQLAVNLPPSPLKKKVNPDVGMPMDGKDETLRRVLIEEFGVDAEGMTLAQMKSVYNALHAQMRKGSVTDVPKTLNDSPK